MDLQYKGTRARVRSSDAVSGMLPLIAIASLLLGLSISNQSLWIDEGLTAWLASQHGLSGLFHAMRVASEATTQPLEPAYHLYTWGWVKVFGVSEFALRASNIPFAVLFVSALAWSSRLSLGSFRVDCPRDVSVLGLLHERGQTIHRSGACVTLSLVAQLAYFTTQTAEKLLPGSVVFLCGSLGGCTCWPLMPCPPLSPWQCWKHETGALA